MITDTDRLEWLYNQNGVMTLRANLATGECVVWDQSNGLCLAGKGSTMRAAIDDAMNYKKGEWNE